LNTDRPLRLGHELQGQVVVLDFWTYCCINCMHILPDLAFLEHKYAEEPVTFIGVHSAKFSNEASPETIRQAILRYEIAHPVVVDDGMKLWRQYAVRSWPTVVVIDSRGYVVGVAAGEGNRDVLDHTIAEALAQGRANKTLATGPIKLKGETIDESASGLAFPGKVLADAETRRLYVADSNHNRVVIAELPDEAGRAKVVAIVGSGEIGRADGPADRATFNHPQGMAVAHGSLYVTDTENHLIRAIDLASFEVTTVVGTGEMTYDHAGGGMGTQQGINSPWDLVVEGSTLYVAMAGEHQIWRIDLPVGFARALAGNGRENIVDGPTETSAFAQPSGICICDGVLYVADSEVSAIRGIDMAKERVYTVIGQGLFAFGDADGAHPKAKLQHPLGVATWGKSLLVADTYNHKIKMVDPKARSVRTLVGSGRPCTRTDAGGPGFFEPGGLSVLDDRALGDPCVFVADTNNHRIVRLNLMTQAWHEIAFDGLVSLASPLTKGGSRGVEDQSERSGQIIEAGTIDVAPGCDIDLVLDISLPPRAHYNPDAPWRVRVTVNGTILVANSGRSDRMPLKTTVPVPAVITEDEWMVSASFTYCTEADRGVCVPAEVSWRGRARPRDGASTCVLRGAVS